MGTALGLLFLWMIASKVIAEFLPLIFEALGHLIHFLFLAAAQTARLIFRAIISLIIALFHLGGSALRAFAQLARLAARHAWAGAVFFFFFVQELRRGPSESDAADFSDETQDEAEEDESAARYAEALARLRLSPGFDQGELRKAYRSAMQTAHPDVAGGSTQAAQEVNEANDILRAAHGWA